MEDIKELQNDIIDLLNSYIDTNNINIALFAEKHNIPHVTLVNILNNEHDLNLSEASNILKGIKFKVTYKIKNKKNNDTKELELLIKQCVKEIFLKYDLGLLKLHLNYISNYIFNETKKSYRDKDIKNILINNFDMKIQKQNRFKIPIKKNSNGEIIYEKYRRIYYLFKQEDWL